MNMAPLPRRHHGSALVACLFVAAAAVPARAQLIDSSFNAVVTGTVVNTVAVQADGKVLIGGLFTAVNGVTRRGLARLFPDGSLDLSFTAGPNTGYVNCVLVQPDGKIIVLGYWGNFNGLPRNNIVRLNPDGSLDGGFIDPPTSEPMKAVLQPDGKILVGGLMAAVQGGHLIRLNPDGTRDGSFAPGPNNIVFDVVLQQDGSVLLGGQFTSVSGVTRNRIARVHANGSLDGTFDPNADSIVRAIALRPDGKIVVGGQFSYIAGDFRNRVALLNPNGTRDTSFNPNVNNTVHEIATHADGTTLIGGNFTTVGGSPARMLVRLLADGSLDPTFTAFSGTTTGSIRAIVVQPDEKILAAGDFGLNNIVRFLPRLPDPSNLPPTITAPPNQTIVDPGGGVTTSPLPFTVSDPEGQPVTVTASSSNPGLVPPSGIVLGGVGANRTVTLSTAGAIAGIATITLTASDGVHTSSASFTVSVTLQRGPPRNLAAVVARNGVNLSWEAPLSAEPVTGYLLEVGFSPGATALTLPVGNVLTFSANAPDGNFFVRVRAETGSGLSAPSNEVQFATGQAGPPLAPQSLLATVVGTSVTLQWSENPFGPAISFYQLDAGSTPGASDLATVPLPATARGLSASAGAGTYYVRVRAGNAAGTGPPSNEETLTLGPGICTIPEMPTGLLAGAAAGGVTISWSAPTSGAIPTGYRLEAGSSPGAADIGTFTLPPGTTLTAPAPAGTYYIRLAATNVCGSSPKSQEVSFVVP